MQTAKCLVVLNEFKSSVPKQNITPAEAQFLVLSHSDNAGELAVKNLTLTEDVKRTSSEELNRLKGLYLVKHSDAKRVTITSIWPGANPKLPEKFSEVVDKEGNAIWNDSGTLLTAPKQPDAIIIGGVAYTKEELEKLVASKVKIVEKTDEELKAAGEDDIVIEAKPAAKPSAKK